ncbi:MAG: hypothetical protein A3F11_01240 [Gammaproteobacteria bacterium RIFCSPHIGHO2_12_FULL_37_14]|nr:MAG: hypothetical protein A3F11_01240 [Gammaproteobacteria bacterium RIFCSPHIGHO2_12_FULL_37_14]
MPKLEYGDILIHVVVPQTTSGIRSFISNVQYYLFGANYHDNVHVSIYVGTNRDGTHRVVEIDMPGLVVGEIIPHEKIHIIRCKNKKLATLAADIALSWGIISANHSYSLLNYFRTILPGSSTEYPPSELKIIEECLFKPLPSRTRFTCVELVTTAYRLAIEQLGLSAAKYMSFNPHSSPADFRRLFDNHSEYEHEDFVFEPAAAAGKSELDQERSLTL